MSEAQEGKQATLMRFAVIREEKTFGLGGQRVEGEKPYPVVSILKLCETRGEAEVGVDAECLRLVIAGQDRGMRTPSYDGWDPDEPGSKKIEYYRPGSIQGGKQFIVRIAVLGVHARGQILALQEDDEQDDNDAEERERRERGEEG